MYQRDQTTKRANDPPAMALKAVHRASPRFTHRAPTRFGCRRPMVSRGARVKCAQTPTLTHSHASQSPRSIAISTPPDEGAMAGEPPACSEHGHRSLFRLYRSGYHPRRLSRHSHRGGDASTADGVGLDGSKTRVEEGNGARCRGVVKPRLGTGVSGSKYSPMYPC